MIKGISSSGRYIRVGGGIPSSNYVNHYSGAQGIGNMRFNTSNQYIEIFDGANWQPLGSSYATVGLDQEAVEILDWAKAKRDEERQIKELIKTNPAVKIAYEAVIKAQEQLQITTILSKDHEKTTS
jgi:hypothetical protein